MLFLLITERVLKNPQKPCHMQVGCENPADLKRKAGVSHVTTSLAKTSHAQLFVMHHIMKGGGGMGEGKGNGSKIL